MPAKLLKFPEPTPKPTATPGLIEQAISVKIGGVTHVLRISATIEQAVQPARPARAAVAPAEISKPD